METFIAIHIHYVTYNHRRRHKLAYGRWQGFICVPYIINYFDNICAEFITVDIQTEQLNPSQEIIYP